MTQTTANEIHQIKFPFTRESYSGPLDGEGWDYHYIWCCRAIAWAIEQYDKSKVTEVP